MTAKGKVGMVCALAAFAAGVDVIAQRLGRLPTTKPTTRVATSNRAAIGLDALLRPGSKPEAIVQLLVGGGARRLIVSVEKARATQRASVPAKLDVSLVLDERGRVLSATVELDDPLGELSKRLQKQFGASLARVRLRKGTWGLEGDEAHVVKRTGDTAFVVSGRKLPQARRSRFRFARVAAQRLAPHPLQAKGPLPTSLPVDGVATGLGAPVRSYASAEELMLALSRTYGQMDVNVQRQRLVIAGAGELPVQSFRAVFLEGRGPDIGLWLSTPACPLVQQKRLYDLCKSLGPATEKVGWILRLTVELPASNVSRPAVLRAIWDRVEKSDGRGIGMLFVGCDQRIAASATSRPSGVPRDGR